MTKERQLTVREIQAMYPGTKLTIELLRSPGRDYANTPARLVGATNSKDPEVDHEIFVNAIKANPKGHYFITYGDPFPVSEDTKKD